MKRFIILSLQLYRSLVLYNIAFTLLWLFLFAYGTGSINASSLICGKIAGFLSAAALHYFSSHNSYFYFRNAGYQVRRILIANFAIDLFLGILAASLFNLPAHAYLKG